MTPDGKTRTCWLPVIATGSRRLRMGMLCALMAAIAGSCSEGTTATEVTGTEELGVAAPAAQVAKAAGDSQTVSPDKAVPVPPAVRVTDQSGNAVSGTHVRFTVAAGGGSVTGGDATTDANGVATVGNWTLGAAKGRNLLTASVGEGLVVTFAATAAEYSPDVTPFVGPPRADTVVGDTLQVVATVTSRYEVTSVHAAVGATDVELSFPTQNGRWEGIVPLHGMPRDTLQLVVTARDVNGSATDKFVTFVHDRAPTLTVAAPGSGTVARPSIDFSADCVDDDPAGCSSLVVEAQYAEPPITPRQTLATGQSHVDGTGSLPDFEGHALDLVFTATDSRGQVARVSRMVYVESSTKLSEIVTSDGMAMDLRGDHVLYRGADGTIALRTLTSGTPQAIYADTANGAQSPYGFVTSTGAIFVVGIPSVPFARVLEWRNGTLLDLGDLNSEASLRVSADYAIFSNGPTLTRRDLAAGTNVTVSANAGNWKNGVAPNGDVAFWSIGDGRVYRYHDGTTTLLTPDDGTGRTNTWPVTDGVNVVFRKGTPCCSGQTYAIVLHDGSDEVVLAPARSQEPWPERDYAVNAGWTAFTTLGGGVLQIWTRSPTGELRQVSFFGTSSKLSALASDGTVIFENGTRRYLAAPGGTPQDIMSSLGTMLWRDGRFVALIGRTAFAVTP